MKKIFILELVIISILFASCTSSKQARTYKKTIDGNWQLQTVVTEGIIGTVKVQLFNEADFNCFVGSTWMFNKSNSLGTYSLEKNINQCVPLKRNIRWSVYEDKGEPKLLQFKRLDDKIKQMDDGNGFRFDILQLDNNTMQLKSTLTFENRPAAIIYNFVRN